MEIKNSSEEIKRESLKDFNVSSHTHAVDSFADELKEFKKEDTYEIPDRYFINNIVLLPVNSETGYFYWEVTLDFVAGKCDREIENFVVRVYEIDSATALGQYDIYGQKGGYYFSTHSANKNIFALLGVFDEKGEFIEILRSNTVKMPSDFIIESDETMWADKLEDWTEILNASLEKIEIGSSENMIKEIESIKRYHKLRVDLSGRVGASSLSSGEFLGSSNTSSFSLSKK